MPRQPRGRRPRQADEPRASPRPTPPDDGREPRRTGDPAAPSGCRRPRRAARPERRQAGSLLELVVIVAVALGLALGIQQSWSSRSGSRASRWSRRSRSASACSSTASPAFSDPDRGDIVVFKPPAAPTRTVRRRSAPRTRPVPSRRTAVGHELHQARRRRPGDRLKVLGGRVYINGKPQDEPFIVPTRPARAATSRRRSRFRRITFL